MKRYSLMYQPPTMANDDCGDYVLYREAHAEFDTMAKLCATKIEEQQAEIEELADMLEGAGYKRQGDCWVSSFISSVCDKGTKGCIANHKHKGE